jgi:hypothetical protein
MTAFTDLVTRVREALSVDESYEATIIPYGIKRAGKRLLRDYHFPWAVQKQVFANLAAGSKDYAMPTAYKKELLVRFFDTEDLTYSNSLAKSDGPVLIAEDGVPRKYWIWGGSISTDIVLDATQAATTQLEVWFESLDWDANETWLLARFEDILYTYSTFRIAAEKNKTELAQIYASLWTDEQRSLAIYLNELEFDNQEFYRRESSAVLRDRYPA